MSAITEVGTYLHENLVRPQLPGFFYSAVLENAPQIPWTSPRRTALADQPVTRAIDQASHLIYRAFERGAAHVKGLAAELGAYATTGAGFGAAWVNHQMGSEAGTLAGIVLGAGMRPLLASDMRKHRRIAEIRDRPVTTS